MSGNIFLYHNRDGRHNHDIFIFINNKLIHLFLSSWSFLCLGGQKSDQE